MTCPFGSNKMRLADEIALGEHEETEEKRDTPTGTDPIGALKKFSPVAILILHLNCSTDPASTPDNANAEADLYMARNCYVFDQPRREPFGRTSQDGF